jgi:hypothetical protein
MNPLETYYDGEPFEYKGHEINNELDCLHMHANEISEHIGEIEAEAGAEHFMATRNAADASLVGSWASEGARAELAEITERIAALVNNPCDDCGKLLTSKVTKRCAACFEKHSDKVRWIRNRYDDDIPF